MKGNVVNFLVWIYEIKWKWLRRQIERVIVRIDGGYFWSKGLRKIYKDYYGIDIGLGSYGCFDSNRFPAGTVVGKYCSIAAESRYLNANHPTEFVTTHPMFCNKSLGGIKEDKIVRSSLEIGNDVWIGYGTIILAGCKKIGNGAVVGAGSVVTKDIEPYGIYAGAPAKLIKKRFSEEICNKLEKSRWYELPPEELLKYEKELEQPEIFVEKFKGKE